MLPKTLTLYEECIDKNSIFLYTKIVEIPTKYIIEVIVMYPVTQEMEDGWRKLSESGKKWDVCQIPKNILPALQPTRERVDLV